MQVASEAQSPPLNSPTVVFHSTVILGLPSTACCSTCDARKLSRRWMSVTCEEVRASTRASSMAVSPPPMTAQCFSRHRKPSHVAHELTPPPRYMSSPGAPSQRLSAPVETMSACAVSAEVLVLMTKGRLERSTLATGEGEGGGEGEVWVWAWVWGWVRGRVRFG